MRAGLYFAPCPLLLSILSPANASDFNVQVQMREKAAETFYVPAYIPGAGPTELMVDTGSGYITINEQTLAVVKRRGSARYLRDLQGVLADGSEVTVPVYALKALEIGGGCWLRDVEAAVFPGTSRQILGLSALRKAAPFIFSIDPPLLKLSHCAGADGAASDQLPVAQQALTAAN
jgi:predicted aspartyl protease